MTFSKKQIDKFNRTRIQDANKAIDHYINVMLHSEANTMNEQFKAEQLALLLTNKEKNALQRSDNTLKTLSTFCKSQKQECQAFRIDEALTEFHTMKELLNLLSDCREARVKSHISFLQHNFKHTCMYVTKLENKKLFFKFELLKK